MTKATVSVVTTTRNAAETIGRCLASLLPYQHRGLITDVVLVDSQSSDDTLKIASRYHVVALREEGVKAYRDWRSGGTRASQWGIVVVAGVLLFLSLVPFLPYYLGLDSQVSGVFPVEGPATRPLHFFLVWGGHILILAPFVLLQVAHAVKAPAWRPARVLAVANPRSS